MKAMILAAGEGRRLRPLTDAVPKPMLPVGGRPLVVHLIDLLRSHGVREIAINLHHQPEAISAFLGDGRHFGVRVTYSLEERLLGSAGGVKRMEAFFGDEPFLVIYGDVLTGLDLTALHAFHTSRGAALTMALHQPEALNECGVVDLSEDGRVLAFVEKPGPGEEPSRWANAGIYIVEPPVLRQIPPDTPFDFGADLFPLLLERAASLYGYVSDAPVVDIGTPEGYVRAEAVARRLSTVEAGRS